MSQSATLRLVEVGPRDGLQNETSLVSSERKIAFIDALSASGLEEIEVSAFVRPDKIPQLDDAERVFSGIERREGVIYSALVPNTKGMERALAAGIDKASMFTAASETFNQKNIGTDFDGSLERFTPIVEQAAEAKVRTRVYVSTAFWCPFEGAIAPQTVLEAVKKLQDVGLKEISIGDTIGKADEDQTRRLLDILLKIIPLDELFLHFHDTYGRALRNASVAFSEFGVNGFDASVAGLGGCPYAPGATGNVATEDLVENLSKLGLKHAIDLKALRNAGATLIQGGGLQTSSRRPKERV